MFRWRIFPPVVFTPQSIGCALEKTAAVGDRWLRNRPTYRRFPVFGLLTMLSRGRGISYSDRWDWLIRKQRLSCGRYSDQEQQAGRLRFVQSVGFASSDERRGWDVVPKVHSQTRGVRKQARLHGAALAVIRIGLAASAQSCHACRVRGLLRLAVARIRRVGIRAPGAQEYGLGGQEHSPSKQR